MAERRLARLSASSAIAETKKEIIVEDTNLDDLFAFSKADTGRSLYRIDILYRHIESKENKDANTKMRPKTVEGGRKGVAAENAMSPVVLCRIWPLWKRIRNTSHME